MKGFKPMVKMQNGGVVVPMNPAISQGPLGEAKPAGPTASLPTNKELAKPYKSGGKKR